MANLTPRILAAALFVLPAFLSAQTAPAKPSTEGEPAKTDEPTKMEAVEVTGSRIRTLG